MSDTGGHRGLHLPNLHSCQEAGLFEDEAAWRLFGRSNGWYCSSPGGFEQRESFFRREWQQERRNRKAQKRNDCKPESAAVSVDHVSARNRNLEPLRSFFDRCIASDVALIVVAIIRFICESRPTGVCSEAGAERFLFGEAREVVGLVE